MNLRTVLLVGGGLATFYWLWGGKSGFSLATSLVPDSKIVRNINNTADIKVFTKSACQAIGGDARRPYPADTYGAGYFECLDPSGGSFSYIG